MKLTLWQLLKKYLMPQKLFSIITPVYNCRSKIEQTIESVWSQKRNLFEHIIIDGCSTDDTLQTIRKYKYPIRLLSEKDSGVYDAMNKGIDLASGQYLYFLGAGDRLQPGILASIKPFMPRDPLAFVYGNVFWEDRNKIYDGVFCKTKIKTHNICHQAIFYGRNIFELLGKFETRFTVLADHAFNIKCFGNDAITRTYIETVIATYEGGGLSNNQRDYCFSKECPELIKNYLEARGSIALR